MGIEATRGDPVSDAVLIYLIGSLVNLLAIVVSRWLSWIEQRKTATSVAVVHENVLKVETATNSMKDALVVATAAEAHARGLREGTAAGIKSETDKKEQLP